MSDLSLFDSVISWMLYLSCVIQIGALLAVVFCSKPSLKEVDKALQPKRDKAPTIKLSEKDSKPKPTVHTSGVKKRKKN